VAIECVCQADIKASAATCLQVATDAARWREWARDLDRVEILSPDPMRVAITISILGEEKSAVIDLHTDPDNNAMTFTLVESESVSDFTGGVRFSGNGSRTRMDADVHATLIRPRAARIERMASRKIETALTRDFLRHVERNSR
jgi:hypothetical protein